MANGDLLIPGSYEEQLAQARALQNRAFQQATQPIDPAQLEALAKRRALGGVEQEGMGAMMTAQGPEALRPLGRAMQARGLEAREPWEAGGGILHEGRFTADPEKGRERLTRALAAQAGAARGFAEEGETQKGRVLARALQQRTLSTPVAAPENWQRLSDDMLYNQVTGEVKPASGGPGAPSAGPGKLTDVQSRAYNAAQRGLAALPQIETALASGYEPNIRDVTWSLTQGNPLVGTMTAAIASKPGMAFYGAGRDILAALLRKESGAQITQDEWREFAPLYLPWNTDTPQLRQEKMVRLRAQIQSAAEQSGPQASRYLQQQQGAAAAGPTAPRPGTPGGRRVEDRARSYGWQD